LQILKISRLSFTLTQEPVLNPKGIDKIDISLQGSSIDTLSGGEFNRVRLALMAVATPKRAKKEGVLILDEIDANVSGDESIAIANLISKLSSSYQVFAISHQPHLASKASQHIVVNKKENKSYAKVLDNNERVEEISRIIAGENPTTQAIEFARKLLDN
jgi:DNA repair protein RecN (Recombination protein N)